MNRSSVRSSTSRNVVRISTFNPSKPTQISLEFHSNAQKTYNRKERVNCYIPTGRTTCQPMTARQQQTIMENNCDGCAVLRFPSDDMEKKHCQLYVAPSALLPLFFFSSRRVDWKRERILDSRNTHSLAMASNFTDLLAVSIELNGRK